MEIFDPYKPRTEFFNAFEGEAADVMSKPPANLRDKSILYGAALGYDTRDIEARLKAGQEARFNAEATIRLQAQEDQRAQSEIDEGLANGTLTLDEARDIYTSNIFSSALMAPSERLLASNSEVGRAQRRAYGRAKAAENLLREKLKQTSTGTADLVGEFADLIVSDGIVDTFFDATGVRNALAKGLNQLITADVPDDEFLAAFNSTLDQMADTGFFTQENSLYLNSLLAQLGEGGRGVESAQQSQDQILNIAGSVLGAPKSVVGALTGALKARDAVDLVRKTGSRSAATQAAVTNAETGVGEVVRHTSVSALTPANPDKADQATVAAETMFEIEAGNSIVDFIRRQARFAGVVDDDKIEEIVQAEKKAFVDEAKKTTVRRLVNFDIEDDGLNNLVGVAYLGKSDGTLFATAKQAETLAKRVGGTVVEQLDEGNVKYLVRLEKNVDPTSYVNKTNIKEVTGGWFSGLLSTVARTTRDLSSVVLQNEGQAARVFQMVAKEHTRAARRVTKAELGEVDSIIRKLNDDPRYNTRRTPFTVNEFKELYYQRTQKQPSQNAVDLYLNNIRLSDAEYVLRADRILKRAVTNGEQMFRLEGSWVRGKVAKEIADTTKVFDLKTGQVFTKGELGDVRILELADDGMMKAGSTVRFVTGQDVPSRRLYHTDVLGYNPGGSRIYNGKFFLKQPSTVRLIDGTEDVATPKTFMVTQTFKEAKAAEDQINAIVDYIRKNAGVDWRLAREALSADTVLRDLIRANNDWNINIDNVNDFIRFMDNQNLNPTVRVSLAPDGEQILDSRFAGGETIAEHTLVNSNKKRGTRPLMGYGGLDADTLDPTDAVERSFVASLNRFADQSYITRAVNGWLKAAADVEALGGKPIISNLSELQGMSSIERLRNAKVSPDLPGASKFEAERNLILSKIDYKTRDMVAWERLMDNVGDYVYDKGWKKMSARFRDTQAPQNWLKSMAFHMKLGLFAFDQLYVQASQVVNIVAMSPFNGLRGTVMVTPIRMALVAPNSEALSLIAKRMAAITGTSEEDFLGIVRYIRESGRNIVDQNIVELSGNTHLYNSKMKSFLNAGRVFFNEGELYARLSAGATAYLDYRKMFPKSDPFSDEAFKWITRRQDVMTASMTNASAAPWQKSIASVPFQFLTYHMRMMEQMFITGEKGLISPAERARILSVQAAMFGGAGLAGYGYWQDKLAYQYNVEVPEWAYSLVRYGLSDYFLSNLTGADTAVSARLGVGDGMWDLLEKISTGSIGEIVAGPSGQISNDLFPATIQLATNMFSGNWEYTSYDWQKLARNITSVNRVYNWWFASQYGEFRRRSDGGTILEDLDDSDAFALAMGVPLQEQELAYTLYSNQKSEKEAIQEHGKKMLEMRRIMLKYIDEGDFTSAREIGDDITALWVPLTPYNKEEVKRILDRTDGDFFKSILQRELERGNRNTLTSVAQEVANGRE